MYGLVDRSLVLAMCLHRMDGWMDGIEWSYDMVSRHSTANARWMDGWMDGIINPNDSCVCSRSHLGYLCIDLSTYLLVCLLACILEMSMVELSTLCCLKDWVEWMWMWMSQRFAGDVSDSEYYV